MIEWKDVLQHVVSTLGHKSGDCILEFLSVLPEEVTEGRKISLSVRALNRHLAYTGVDELTSEQIARCLIYSVITRKRSYQAEQKNSLRKTQGRFLDF